MESMGLDTQQIIGVSHFHVEGNTGTIIDFVRISNLNCFLWTIFHISHHMTTTFNKMGLVWKNELDVFKRIHTAEYAHLKREVCFDIEMN